MAAGTDLARKGGEGGLRHLHEGGGVRARGEGIGRGGQKTAAGVVEGARGTKHGGGDGIGGSSNRNSPSGEAAEGADRTWIRRPGEVNPEDPSAMLDRSAAAEEDEEAKRGEELGKAFDDWMTTAATCGSVLDQGRRRRRRNLTKF